MGKTNKYSRVCQTDGCAPQGSKKRTNKLISVLAHIDNFVSFHFGLTIVFTHDIVSGMACNLYIIRKVQASSSSFLPPFF